jgi:hypothetical protein
MKTRYDMDCRITLLQREQLQEDIITHCDSLPAELIAKLCEVVVNFPYISEEI